VFVIIPFEKLLWSRIFLKCLRCRYTRLYPEVSGLCR